MEMDDAIKMLVEYPKSLAEAEMLITLSEEDGAIKAYMSSLTMIGQLIKGLTTEKEKINKTLLQYERLNNFSEKDRATQQIFMTNNGLVSKKISEKENIRNLIRSKCNYIAGNMEEVEYKKTRDALLTDIILNRANIYRTKEWLKAWSEQHQVPLDYNWYKDSLNIYMEGNRRDRVGESIDKAQQARIIESNLRDKVENGESILPSANQQREAIAFLLIAPEYLSKRIREIPENSIDRRR